MSSIWLMYCKLKMVLGVLLRLPMWACMSAFSSTRPRPNWPFRRSLAVYIIKYVTGRLESDGVSMNDFLDLPDHRALRDGADVLGVYVDGVPQEYLQGEIKDAADLTGVVPVRIPGYWMHQENTANEPPMAKGQKPTEGEKVIYYLHGGSYIAMSAHPSSSTAALPRSLLALQLPAIKRAFSIEYRLCAPHCDSTPKSNDADADTDIASLNPFPAQLLDALAGYTYLVHTVGFPPSSIILTGDSAGGHLALALTLYLTLHSPGSLSTPGALLLLSPWADMSGSHNLPGGSMETNRDCDIDSSPVAYGTVDAPAAFLRAPNGRARALHSPYFSPAGHFVRGFSPIPSISDSVADNADSTPTSQAGGGGGREPIFRSFPPTLVTAGTAEMLLDQIRSLVRRMREDMGDVAVSSFEAEDAVHDCVLFDWHEPERTQTLEVIKAWMESVLV